MVSLLPGCGFGLALLLSFEGFESLGQVLLEGHRVLGGGTLVGVRAAGVAVRVGMGVVVRVGGVVVGATGCLAGAGFFFRVVDAAEELGDGYCALRLGGGLLCCGLFCGIS